MSTFSASTEPAMNVSIEVEKEVEKEVMTSPPAEKANGRMDMFFSKVRIALNSVEFNTKN